MNDVYVFVDGNYERVGDNENGTKNIDEKRHVTKPTSSIWMQNRNKVCDEFKGNAEAVEENHDDRVTHVYSPGNTSFFSRGNDDLNLII